MKKSIEAYWNKFCTERSIAHDTPYTAWSFGNTPEMADELAELVKQGIKTATTPAYELYTAQDVVPSVGEYNIILDGAGKPVCITQTKVVYIVAYNLISPGHAWHEGEGDRSYASWRSGHDAFFETEYQEYGKKFYEQAPMLCEVFEKVY